MPAGFFVTGTDTAVGKTFVAVSLTRALVARGIRTAVMKPVAAGGIRTPEGFFNDDALDLLAASNVKAPYDDVNPWMLSMPASPHLAARADGVAIGHDRIVAALERLKAASDLVIVEGAGGWHAPISATETMADVAGKLALPVVLVVGIRLGCLNHALLTRAAIRAHGLVFAGWVANKLAAEMPLADANIDTLSNRFGVMPLTVVPAGASNLAQLQPAPSAWADEVAERLLSP
jgi:dethiobiotin synthetase